MLELRPNRLRFLVGTNVRHATNAAIVLFSIHRVDGNDANRAGRNARSSKDKGAPAGTALTSVTLAQATLGGFNVSIYARHRACRGDVA